MKTLISLWTHTYCMFSASDRAFNQKVPIFIFSYFFIMGLMLTEAMLMSIHIVCVCVCVCVCLCACVRETVWETVCAWVCV